MSTRLFLLFATREEGKSSRREERRTPKLRGQGPGVPTSSRQTPGFPHALPALRRQEPPLATPLTSRGIFRQLPGGAAAGAPATPLPKGPSGPSRFSTRNSSALRGPTGRWHRCPRPPERERSRRCPCARLGAPGVRRGRGGNLRAAAGGWWGWRGFGVPGGCGEPGAGWRCETRRACPGTMTWREGTVCEGGLG